MAQRITRTKRVERQALMEVLASPQATPKQKLDAQARLNRLKYKPRGRHVKNAEQVVQTQAVEPKPADNSTSIEAILASYGDYLREMENLHATNPEEYRRQLDFWDTPERKAKAAGAYRAALAVYRGESV